MAWGSLIHLNNLETMSVAAFMACRELRVYSHLYLQGHRITRLPENLYVEGSLNLSGTLLTELPDTLHIEGYLDLEGTKIESLFNNLYVSGYLDLRGTNVKKLPKNLRVGGYLDIRGLSLTVLPSDLYVGGYIYDDLFKFFRVDGSAKDLAEWAEDNVRGNYFIVGWEEDEGAIWLEDDYDRIALKLRWTIVRDYGDDLLKMAN